MNSLGKHFGSRVLRLHGKQVCRATPKFRFLYRVKRPGARIPAAFTLIELMVVIGIIALLATLALPSMVKLFSSGADSQAYNLLAAQIAAARAHAIKNQTYAAVHVQMGLAGSRYDGKQYTAVMQYNSTTKQFELADGFDPLPLPGTIVLGALDSNSVLSGAYSNNLTGDLDNPSQPAGNFATFTIVFSSSGSLVAKVNDVAVYFDTSAGLFSGGANQLWTGSGVNGEDGVMAVTLFDKSKFEPLLDSDDRATFLNNNGQFIPINVYTGQLFPRQ